MRNVLMKLHTLPAWKTATRLMTSEQRENIQTQMYVAASVKKHQIV